MSTSLSMTLLAPLILGLVSSFIAEALLSPRPRPVWQRGLAANSLHLGSWLLLFGVVVLVLQRPWFTVVFILSLLLVIVQSSNTKSRTLNEPFICHDFEYFWDAIRHPRLYVPFFGIGLAIAASSAGAIAIGSFFYFEPSLINPWGVETLLLHGLGLAATGSALIWLGWYHLPPTTLAPANDLHRLGLFASLWAYGVDLMRSTPPTPESSPFHAITPHAPSIQEPAERPNVVLVQSESFFDPRPWYQDIAPSLLANFDAIRDQAIQQGELSVPAWGANTVRTECAVLTGLAPSTWGIRQFNPYRTLSRHPLPSIASAFKAHGYRTVCVHPYPATFYMRDSVIPKLGFDEFLDIREFDHQDKNGQYIGDRAVARKVGRLLEDDDNRPLFIFVITMENHGPLHLEAPHQAQVSTTLPNARWPLPEHLRDLAVYLHHLGEADQMLARVKTALAAATRPGVLGWYGDHVPILPAAYRYFSPPTGSTPYMIWSTQCSFAQRHTGQTVQGMAANELGVQLFKQALGRDINHDVIKAEPEHQEQE